MVRFLSVSGGIIAAHEPDHCAAAALAQAESAWNAQQNKIITMTQ
jgi:hypothetical protein